MKYNPLADINNACWGAATLPEKIGNVTLTKKQAERLIKNGFVRIKRDGLLIVLSFTSTDT